MCYKCMIDTAFHYIDEARKIPSIELEILYSNIACCILEMGDYYELDNPEVYVVSPLTEIEQHILEN